VRATTHVPDASNAAAYYQLPSLTLPQTAARPVDNMVRVGTLGPKVNRRVQVQFEDLRPSPVEGIADAAD
jgi:hypothetical protein